jgi:hypothetical protein
LDYFSKVAKKIESILKKQYRQDKGRSEWALLSKKSNRVLKWFGPTKPSHDRVLKEERRVQYFKHLHGTVDDIVMRNNSISDDINSDFPLGWWPDYAG